MNKKAIWIIIGLMGVALIGSLLLQMYWIRWSIHLNESQFEKNVFAALNNISVKMQRAEYLLEQHQISQQINAYPNLKYTSAQTVQQKIGPDGIVKTEMNFEGTITIDSLLKMGQIGALETDEEECNCSNCVRERLEEYKRVEAFREKMLFNKLINPPPITKRVNLKKLDDVISHELANRGIHINFDYGVYSIKEQAFVISNGRYLVSDQNEQTGMAGWDILFNSEYRADLFPDDMEPPGMLMVHFPTKASLVWGSVWKTLLSAILFTGIILFCFAYTIQVIFRQKKLSEMKTDFINNMTHEFKTPIATISLAADSITSPRILGNEEKVSRFAGIIKQENRRMNNQVEKVLQMALIDKRDFKMNLTEINIHQVINQAVANANLQVEKKGGTVVADLQAGNPRIEGDLTHITNVVSNLLDNANKYSPKQPEISVHTRNVAGGVEVIVKDKGIGMTSEARKHIFDKFYRVHTGDVHDVKGFGLGLSYVKAILTAHKGQIDVKSELGKGSSFILVFPHRLNE